MISISQNKLIICALFSIAFHILFFNLLSLLANSSFFNFKNISYVDQNAQPRIEIENLSQDQLKRFRTVGVKDGKKGFSLPHETKQKTQVSKQNPAQKNISMSSLRVDEKTQAQQNNEVKPVRKTELDGLATEKQIIVRKQKKLRKEQILQNLAVSPENVKNIQAADFDVKFEPPEGITEDELNTIEKIFYGFQKRTFHSYVKSFIHSFNELKMSKPLLKNVMNDESHKLTGRITFDKSGNIISIKILRWSTNDDVQALFEKTLTEIRKLPNPPQALLNKSNEFTIYYQLHINE